MTDAAPFRPSLSAPIHGQIARASRAVAAMLHTLSAEGPAGRVQEAALVIVESFAADTAHLPANPAAMALAEAVEFRDRLCRYADDLWLLLESPPTPSVN